MARSPIRVAIPLFDRFTALDGIGPYEVLQRIPWLTVTFVGHERGVVRSENRFLGIEVDATFDELPDPEVIVFPGGIGTRALMDDDTVLGWVRTAHETTRVHDLGVHRIAGAGAPPACWTGSPPPPTGAPGTTLTRYGAEPVPERVVEHLDRRIITAAGVSSGIDMALRLTELLVDATAARAMQLMIEYDPQPPFDSGALEKSDDATMTRLIEYAAHRD